MLFRSLISPIAMEEGLRFAIREGGKTVGAGVVAKILKELSDRRKRRGRLSADEPVQNRRITLSSHVGRQR